MMKPEVARKFIAKSEMTSKSTLITIIKDLANQVDALQADSERYRYYIESSPNGEMCFMGECYSGKKALDNAIDEARSNHEPF